jgi:two-component system sensor histidine kinase RstB
VENKLSAVNGPGIPEADRKRIFEPFTRLDSSRSRISGGYGLGLAIVQQIVSWHGGKVVAIDSPLGGARFSIRWPGFAKNPHKMTVDKYFRHTS